MNKLSVLPIDMIKLVKGAMIVGEGRPYYDYYEGIKQETGGYFCQFLSLWNV